MSASILGGMAVLSAAPDPPDTMEKRGTDSSDLGDNPHLDGMLYAANDPNRVNSSEPDRRSGRELASTAPNKGCGDVRTGRFTDRFVEDLRVVVASVRCGDLERARAAADALEFNILLERSARVSFAPVESRILETLKRFFKSNRSDRESDERVAFERSELDTVGQAENRSRVSNSPSLQRRNEPVLGAAASAYDMLIAYTGGETR